MAELERMLDESQAQFEKDHPRKVYSTWKEWWGALLYQVKCDTLRATPTPTHTHTKWLSASLSLTPLHHGCLSQGQG